MSSLPTLINTAHVFAYRTREPHIITRRFLAALTFFLDVHCRSQKQPQLIADFDELFFMVIMRSFFHNHTVLRSVFTGEQTPSLQPSHMRADPRVLRDSEARTFIQDETDPIAHRFLIAAYNHLQADLTRSQTMQPCAPFDVLVCMAVLADFVRIHDFIRDLLDGKEINEFEPRNNENKEVKDEG